MFSHRAHPALLTLYGNISTRCMLSCREMTVAFLTVSVSEHTVKRRERVFEPPLKACTSMKRIYLDLAKRTRSDVEMEMQGFFAGSEGIKYIDVGKEEKMFLFRILIRT